MMINKNLINKLFLLLAGCSVALALNAQAVKQVEVGQDESYTEHISLAEDTKDMDLIVKFVFNEAENTLTVSLISYRNLFVFQDDVRYSHVIRRRCLKPDRLPYVVTAEENSKFKLTKFLRKSITGSRRKHIFNRWIDYKGIQPRPMEYKMVDPYIEQVFEIQNKNSVTITLRDILVMEAVSSRKGKKKYHLLLDKNLNRTYHITLHRNPCFGQEEEIAAATHSLESIATGYQNLSKRFGDGLVRKKEDVNLFDEMKGLLLMQFAPNAQKSTCPQVQHHIDAYNQYVDSIRQLKCVYLPEKSSAPSGVNAEYILTQARQIDNAVSRWLLIRDKVEQMDIEQHCQSIIKDMNGLVAEEGLADAGQKSAMIIFRKAERYFKSVCKKTEDNHGE